MIEGQERKVTGSDSIIVEGAKSVEALPCRRICAKCFAGNGSRRTG